MRAFVLALVAFVVLSPVVRADDDNELSLTDPAGSSATRPAPTPVAPEAEHVEPSTSPEDEAEETTEASTPAAAPVVEKTVKVTPVEAPVAQPNPVEAKTEYIVAQPDAVKSPTIGDPPSFDALPPTATEPPPAFTYELHGFVRGGYTWIQRDAGSFSVGQNSGFRLQNTRLGVQGGYGKSVRFDISIDHDAQLNGLTNQAPFTVALRDAFVDLRHGWMHLKVGQFRPPFNGELLLSDGEIPFARRSVAATGILGDEGRIAWGMLGLDRSIGASGGVRVPFGGDAALEFDVAAVNGNGMNQGRNDNAKPAVAARLAFGFKGTTIAASGLWNDRTVGGLVNQQDERDLAGDVSIVSVLGPVRLFGQWIVQQTAFIDTKAKSNLAQGIVGSASFLADVGMVKLEPAYRFTYYSPTALLPQAGLMDHTAGVNVLAANLPVRLQLNYTLRIERALRTAPNDMFETVLQANF